MILTTLWQKPGNFPIQSHLPGGFPNPLCFSSAHTQHPWQAALLDPRHKDHGYTKILELPFAAQKGEWSQGCHAKKAILPKPSFSLRALGILVNAWHTKYCLKVFSNDFWNFTIANAYLFWSKLVFLVSSVELNMEYNVDPSVQITSYLWLSQQQGVAALPANAAWSRHNLLSAASFFLPGRSPQMVPLSTHPPKGLLTLGHHKMLTLTI